MPLSPEQAEIKAMKKEKSSNNFTKFIAIVLALALAAGTFVLGQSAAKKAVEEAGQNVVVNGGDTNAPSGNDDVPAGDNVTDAPSDDATDVPAGDDNTADAPAGDANAPAGDNDAAFSKANAHEKLNKWTAAASKGNYKFARVCAYTPDGAIDVGNATGTLNKVINMIDSASDTDEARRSKRYREKKKAERDGTSQGNVTPVTDNVTNSHESLEIRDKSIEIRDYIKRESKERKNTLTHFVPPTVEEVYLYCEERHNGINPQRFVDYYSARGWKGIKDWKSLISVWENTDNGKESIL